MDELNKDKNGDKSEAQSTSTNLKVNDGAVIGMMMILKTKQMKIKQNNQQKKINKIMTNHQRMEFKENQLVNLPPTHPLGKLVAIKEAEQRLPVMRIQKKKTMY